jgi:hypothetical protein
MAGYTPPGSYDHTGINVGSVNSQDVFAGYGTAFLNSDRFKLEMKERIHMLGSSAAPFLSWASMVRKNPTSQIVYSWMEDELFTHRDTKALLKRDANGGVFTLQMLHGGDWQAFEAAPLADAIANATTFDTDKPTIYVTITAGAHSASFIPLAPGLAQGPGTYEFTDDGDTTHQLHGEILLADDSDGNNAVGGNDAASSYERHIGTKGQTASAFVTALEAINGTADTAVEVTVHVWTPDEQLQGYAQGSGLPNETRKRTRSAHNFTQIFKTPYSIANTLKAVELYGGPELARLRLRKAIQHKVELERAILFQGGGIEGTNWGEIPGTTENPLTRFKGLGVGVTSSSTAGFIRTKNADLDPRGDSSPFRLDADAFTMSSINTMTEALFDDTIDAPSSSKVVYASKKWFGALSEAALRTSGNQFVFGMVNQTGNSLGMKIKTLESPHGDLHFVPMPLFRGKYEDYALVCDMNNIEMRPLRGRDTTLFSNVGDDTVDGQLDFYLTEMGFECRHESTHAILKLV